MNYYIAIIHKDPVAVAQTLYRKGLKTILAEGFLDMLCYCPNLGCAISRCNYEIISQYSQILKLKYNNILSLFISGKAVNPSYKL